VRKEFLGRGWKFPFQFNPGTGGVAMSEYEANIRDCITIILGTKPGERQMLPKFGCKIHDLLFAPNTDATAHIATDYVKEALYYFEPRVELKKVHCWPDAAGSLRVQVQYTVRTTMSEEELSLFLNP